MKGRITGRYIPGTLLDWWRLLIPLFPCGSIFTPSLAARSECWRWAMLSPCPLVAFSFARSAVSGRFDRRDQARWCRGAAHDCDSEFEIDGSGLHSRHATKPTLDRPCAASARHSRNSDRRRICVFGIDVHSRLTYTPVNPDDCGASNRWQVKHSIERDSVCAPLHHRYCVLH